MMKTLKTVLALTIVVLSVVSLSSCKDKEPSFAKVYVRSSSNELLSDVQVVLIADKDKNESDSEYVDTLITNSSGYAEFNIGKYYEQTDKSVKIANFDIVCKKSDLQGAGSIRTRVNTTAVETIHIGQ